MEVALPVDGQQVDAFAEVGDDLPADLEQVAQAKDVDARLKDVLQALLAGNAARRDLLDRLAVNPPESEFHRHSRSAD